MSGDDDIVDPLRYLPKAAASEYHVLGLSSDDDNASHHDDEPAATPSSSSTQASAPAPPERKALSESGSGPAVKTTARMKVTVSYAGTVIIGLTQDLSFVVETDGLTAHRFAVRRLCDDFLALRDMLKRSYPGMLVPPLVLHTKLLEGLHGAPAASDRDVQRRLASLQSFVQRLAEHPRLSLSAEVAAFLQLKAFRTVSADASVQIGEQLERLAGSLRREVRSVVDSVTPERGDFDDPQFVQLLQIRELAEQFDHRLALVARSFAELGERSRQSAVTFTALKSHLATLADGETNLQHFYLHLASVCGGLSALHERSAASEDVEFVLPLQEYVQLTASLLDVIKHNVQTLSRFHAAQRALQTARAHHEQLLAEKRQPPRQKAQWIFSFGDDVDTRLDKSVAQLEALVVQVRELQTSVDECSGYFMEEMQLFNVWKVTGFQRVFAVYVDRKIEFHQQAISAWNSLRSDVHSIDTSLASLSVGWWPQEYPVAAVAPPPATHSTQLFQRTIAGPVSALFSSFSSPHQQPPPSLGEPTVGDQPGFSYPTLLTHDANNNN